ncbi:MAG: DUF1641 domain-containing protein [Halobacteriales archaeon]
MSNTTSPTDGNGATAGSARSPGEAALRAAIDEHGEDVAAVLERSDEATELIDTVVLMIASAEEEDIEYLADALSSLVRTADGAATEETVALAEYVGENGADATDALDKLLELDRGGTLDDLLELAEVLSAVDLDSDSVETLNRLLGALEEADDEAEPTGVLGALTAVRGRDAKAGIGYLVALLRATGRRIVDR